MAFANQHFYGDHLGIVSAPFREHPELGVKFHHVADGVMDNGHNAREASVVADLVLAHFRTAPEKSLGVIAFDPAQKGALAAEIERRRTGQPEFKETEEKFYVMDASTVSEDRDVILLSIGYARDKGGVLAGSPEPLDQEEGPRLLNAAITRARQKLVVVSSIRGGDIDPALNTAEAMVLLRQFLGFAETGRLVQEESESEAGPLELDIIRALQARGFTAHAHPGGGSVRPDLAVVDPADSRRYVLGIVLDGPAAFAVSTARVRDRLRQQEWQRLGWNLHPIWAPAWVFRRQEESERLFRALAVRCKLP